MTVQGPMVVLGGVAISYERGTPVGPPRELLELLECNDILGVLGRDPRWLWAQQSRKRKGGRLRGRRTAKGCGAGGA